MILPRESLIIVKQGRVHAYPSRAYVGNDEITKNHLGMGVDAIVARQRQKHVIDWWTERWTDSPIGFAG